MLAQNFKAAADLELSEPQFDALRKTLVLLETGKLVYAKAHGTIRQIRSERKFSGYFNMEYHYSDEDCGTVCCISGTAELVGGVKFETLRNRPLYDLFYPRCAEGWSATPAQAAIALRSYLTTGNARWDLAMGT